MQRISTITLFLILLAACTPSPTELTPTSIPTTTIASTITPTFTPTYTPKPTPTVDSNAHLKKYEGDLAFSFVDGSEPDMPIRNGDGPGYKPQPDDPREQIVIDETFTVSAGEEVIIEDKIVWVRPNRVGNIEVFGTLIVRDSLLLWDQTEHHQVGLFIWPGGNLHIEDSYGFSTNQYWVNWDFFDGSTIVLDKFVSNILTAVFGSVNYTATNFSTVYLILFYNIHDTNIKVSDAHSMYFEIHPPPGVYDLSLPVLRNWIDWTLSDLWPNTTIEIEHSYLFEHYLTVSAGNHITIRDTSDIFLGWNIHKESAGVVECELRNLGDPNRSDGVFYEYQTWDFPCIDASLTLINSQLLQAYPHITGYIHLRVYDSNIIDTGARGSFSKLEIYNSTVENVQTYEGGKVYLEDVKIRHYIEVKDVGSVVYGYGISPWKPGWEYEIIERDGGLFIELDSPGPPW